MLHCNLYLLLSSFLLQLIWCDGFRLSTTTAASSTTGLWGQHAPELSSEVRPHWLNHGLLLSSFSDGLKRNRVARDFLMSGLVKALWTEQQRISEQSVETSAVQSPCCGPDLAAMTKMEESDKAIHRIEANSSSWKSSLDSLKLSRGDDENVELRFLYIPTAMYALRTDSANAPGKQRQRARADGKKRRNEIVNLLQEELGQDVSILAATLDFDDGSVKQPEGSDDTARFPKNGQEAFADWKPHFIYVQGGNTFWLYHCIEKGDWKDKLLHACTGKDAAVYCGTSAGAIIMGEWMETACWKEWDDPSVVPGMETYESWKTVNGFGLAGNVSIFPHMTSQWEPLVESKKSNLERNESRVYSLADEECCFVTGADQQTAVVSCDELKLTTTTTSS